MLLHEGALHSINCKEGNNTTRDGMLDNETDQNIRGRPGNGILRLRSGTVTVRLRSDYGTRPVRLRTGTDPRYVWATADRGERGM